MILGSSQPISKTIGLIVFPLRNPDNAVSEAVIR
jgi:hypothetical protein